MILNILIGATMMLIADWIGSVLIHPVQIPASIILALIGIPTLFYILLKQSKRYLNIHLTVSHGCYVIILWKTF